MSDLETFLRLESGCDLPASGLVKPSQIASFEHRL